MENFRKGVNCCPSEQDTDRLSYLFTLGSILALSCSVPVAKWALDISDVSVAVDRRMAILARLAMGYWTLLNRVAVRKLFSSLVLLCLCLHRLSHPTALPRPRLLCLPPPLLPPNSSLSVPSIRVWSGVAWPVFHPSPVASCTVVPLVACDRLARSERQECPQSSWAASEAEHSSATVRPSAPQAAVPTKPLVQLSSRVSSSEESILSSATLRDTTKILEVVKE